MDDNEDRPLDPAAALALVASQQDDFERRQARSVPWILLAWGIVWVVGFLALWSIDALRPAFALPAPIAIGIFTGLMVAGVVVSAILGIRMGRGFRSTPAAAFTGKVFGITCSAGFVAVYLLGAALLQHGMPRDVANVLFPVLFILLVALMYVMAGAIWHVKPAVALGTWIAVVALVGAFVGYPHLYLLFALAGGGVFLIGAVVMATWARTGRLKGLNG